MKIKVSEAIGQVLDWMVAKCEGFDAIGYEKSRLAFHVNRPRPTDDAQPRRYQPSTNWAQGGPIIEREGFSLRKGGSYWYCSNYTNDSYGITETGSTALEVICRCLVVSRLGDEVEVPEELCQT